MCIRDRIITMHQKPIETGWVEVICGSMFCGKTEELLRRLRRARIAKLSVIAFKPKIDNRYSKNMIVSHDKNSLDSIAIENTKTLFDMGSEYDVVGIDEAQFFSDDLLTACKNLAKNKTRVIVAGLDTDYKGLPFGPMPLIMCESDYLDKLTAICMQCGKDATYTQRITKQTQQVVIGETDTYEARCRSCFDPPSI